jgi:hypothetical protein
MKQELSLGARLDEQKHNFGDQVRHGRLWARVWEFYWDSDAIERTGSNTKSKNGREIGWTGSKDDLWHRLCYYVVDSHLRQRYKVIFGLSVTA